MEVLIRGKRLKLNPKNIIGSGGEADIYDIQAGRSAGQVLKLFKTPDHPDVKSSPADKQAAEERLEEHQRKLPDFPSGLPSEVVAPKELARHRRNRCILGYTMPRLTTGDKLIRYSDKNYRLGKVSGEQVVSVFIHLHKTLTELHRQGVVVGDLNDLNVLVDRGRCYLIDADSFQFGPYACRVCTPAFLDPLLMSAGKHGPELTGSYSPDSDWYAFAAMLMQSLLFVGPYGGVHKPGNKQPRVLAARRPLERITVFDPKVIKPKPALRFEVLPDEMINTFYEIFVQDKRGAFPRHILEGLQWRVCPGCGLEHARSACTVCQPAGTYQSQQTVTAQGSAVAKQVFATRGIILVSGLNAGRLAWLYHENGSFRREDGPVLFTGQPDPGFRFVLTGKMTCAGKNGLLVARSGSCQDKQAVDDFAGQPVFDANSHSLYWLENGCLYKNSRLGRVYWGDALAGRTWFRVGEEFGFGFYRAGAWSICFVFNSRQPGINDRIRLDFPAGELLDAKCYFAGNKCWFLIAIRYKGAITNWCYVISSQGQVLGKTSARSGSQGWLGSLGGKFAFGCYLISPTDEGVKRIKVEGGSLWVDKEFPDTEKFVDSDCQLYLGQAGLYAVSYRKIRLISLQ